jgi:hypothetical protein
MVNNFEGFILENKVVSLILENDLNASPEFLSRLNKIRDKSKVAQILYVLFSKEYYIVKDLPQNWIDVTSEPEIVSFMSDQRAKRTPMQWDEDNSKYYETPGRGVIKIGRFAQALLNDPDVIEDLELSFVEDNIQGLTPRDYEEFVNLYKSEFTVVSNEFKLIKGDEISYYYDVYNHAYGDKGQLGSSCMRYTKCQEYFSIYQKNPEVCQLLAYVNQDNKVLGRALVWKLEKKVDGCPAEYFMDRIYSHSDSDMLKFQNYAKEQGWVMKNKNTSDIVESLFFNYNGQVFLSHVYVKLDNFNFKKFPFVDTLSFLHPVSGKLHNIKGKNTLELTSTGGESYENYDGDSRSSALRTLLEEAVNDPDYYGYRDLIEKTLDQLSSS